MPCNVPLMVDTTHPVLVTGADGYLAGVLIQELLQLGMTVHGTVLDLHPANVQHLHDLASRYHQESLVGGTLRLFQANLLDAQAFAEPMKGCTLVFHTASPYKLGSNMQVDAELIQPAVQGTRHVLEQACRTSTVQKVLLTSSIGAIYSDNADCQDEPGGILTEGCWNHRSSTHHMPYFYSKTLAEMTAWTIAGSQTQWTLIVLNPAMILGPGLKYHPDAESFKTMMRLGGATHVGFIAGAIPFGVPVVDVRDAAAAHVAAALIDPPAQGRHIVCAANTNIVDLARILHRHFPQYPIPSYATWIPKLLIWLLAPYGGMGFDRLFVTRNMHKDIRVDNTKSKQALGMEYLPLETTCIEMYQQLIDSGAVEPATSVLAAYLYRTWKQIRQRINGLLFLSSTSNDKTD